MEKYKIKNLLQKLNFSGIKWKEDKELRFAKRGEVYESIKNRMV